MTGFCAAPRHDGQAMSGAVRLLAVLLAMDEGEQLDALVLAAAAWCYYRDHPKEATP